jgi:AcrR family transcriptional regulator
MAKRGRPPLAGRREEILDGAILVLAERGIENMSLAQLAQALGFSTYALTYHFGSREDVLAAVAEHVEARLQAEFAELARQPGLSMPDLVRRYWATTREPGAGHAMRLWLELVLIASREPDRLPGFLDRATAGWEQVIGAVLGDDTDADTLVPLAFAAITGLELLQLMRPGSDVPGRALEQLIGVFQLVLDSKERPGREGPGR